MLAGVHRVSLTHRKCGTSHENVMMFSIFLFLFRQRASKTGDTINPKPLLLMLE